MKRLTTLLTLLVVIAAAMTAQRRVTPAPPVTPDRPAATQPDRPAAQKRPSTLAEVRDDERGTIVLVDTVTGKEWVDSTATLRVKKMLYPLLTDVSVGVDVWDAAMRIFNQKFGVAGLSARLSLHNRYILALEAGLGKADDTPSGLNFTFHSPLAPYFRIGADYNIFYNNSPDYQFTAGVRYGCSPFKWSVDDVTVDDGYWGTPTSFSLPGRSSFAGWLELTLGVKVKIAGPLAMGWNFKFHKMLHLSGTGAGDPMIIPGFGKKESTVTGAFTIYYTLRLGDKPAPEPVDTTE